MKILLPLENLQYEFPAPERYPQNGFFIYSWAKVCPKCLRLWAICMQPGSGYSVQGHWCLRCWEAHRPQFLPHYAKVAGSLLDDCSTQRVEWALLEFLPEPLIQRELNLHFKVLM